MEETFDFLKKRTQINYVSTINGDKPSLRPFGDPVLFDNKIYVLTKSFEYNYLIYEIPHFIELVNEQVLVV